MAEVDEVYADLCAALQAMAQGEVASLVEGTPEADMGAQLGLDDLSEGGISSALTREAISEKYRKDLDGEGVKVSDTQAAQMQTAVLAAMEKATRLRYRSRVKSLIYGASRSYGQAQDTGYFGLVLPALPLQQSA